MCLDAAVMGTCPTFINQRRRGRVIEEGGSEGEKGNSVRGDGRRERMPGEEGEEESFSGRGGEVGVKGRGRGANKAHIDVLNTAAGVS